MLRRSTKVSWCVRCMLWYWADAALRLQPQQGVFGCQQTCSHTDGVMCDVLCCGVLCRGPGRCQVPVVMDACPGSQQQLCSGLCDCQGVEAEASRLPSRFCGFFRENGQGWARARGYECGCALQALGAGGGVSLESTVAHHCVVQQESVVVSGPLEKIVCSLYMLAPCGCLGCPGLLQVV